MAEIVRRTGFILLVKRDCQFQFPIDRDRFGQFGVGLYSGSHATGTYEVS